MPIQGTGSSAQYWVGASPITASASKPFSISTWFWFPSGTGGSSRALVSLANGATGTTNGQAGLQFISANYAAADFDNVGAQLVGGAAGGATLGTWSMLTGVFTSSSLLHCYINTTNHNGSGANGAETYQEFVLGNFISSGGGGLTSSDFLAYSALWSGALSATDVTNLYGGGSAGADPRSLVSTSGATLLRLYVPNGVSDFNDYSGNSGPTLTAVGGATAVFNNTLLAPVNNLAASTPAALSPLRKLLPGFGQRPLISGIAQGQLLVVPGTVYTPYAPAWLSTVLSTWTPPDPLPTLTAKLVQTTKVSYAPAWLSAVETAWVPPDPLPTLNQKLVQPQGATTNGPYAPKWLSAVLTAWTPPDPLPTLTAKLVQPQGATTNTPYAPAWLSTVETAWVPPDPLPTLPIHLPQPFIAAAVSYAPKWLSAVLSAWIPPDPLPTLTAKLVQPQGATTNSPYAPGWLASVLQTWASPDPAPTLPRYLVQTTKASYAPAWLSGVLQAWEPPNPLPTLTAKLLQAFITPNVSYAPKWLSGIETAWVPPDPLPTLTAKLVQPQGATTNTPYAPAWLSAVLKSWTPADPQPTLTAKLAQSTTTATPYAPKWLSTVLDAWTSLAPPPTLGTKLAQAAQPQFRPHLPSWFGAVYEAWLESESYGPPTLQTYLDLRTPPPTPSGFVPFGVMYGAELLVQIWRPYEDPLPVIPRYRIPIGIPPTPLYAPGVGGLGQGQGTPTAASNLAGLMAVSDDETISFQLYVRWVLPLDGYVFWLGTGAPVVIKGSLHVSIDKRQQEDETISINRVVFTTGEHVQRFNEIAPGQIWVGQYAGLRFAFSASGPRYKSAGLYHYNGDAVYPAMANLLVPVGQELPKDTLIVSNSLPMWLALKTYTPIWLNPPNPLITLYPSFALPDNLEPPYGVVHIEPSGTEALQMAPSFGPTRPIGWTALGTVFGDTNDSTHQQLTSDRVSVTLYGMTNSQALDFIDLVNRYSYDQDSMGIMDASPMRDEKRTQRELGVLAMKKTVEFRVSYYQTRANAVAQQLIKHAHVSVFEFPN